MATAVEIGLRTRSTDWAPTETDWINPVVGTEPLTLENAPLTPFAADSSV
jgi:hypothetical protein